MRVIISSLLLILALHFLLQGINYRKNISLVNKKEEFVIECKKDKSVKPSNNFIDDKNDANFDSDVLDVNQFYKKNEEPEYVSNKPENKLIQVDNSINSDKPVKSSDTWKYKNELVMNGGELLNGVTGFNLNDNSPGNLSNEYFLYKNLDGNMIDDDIRMGLGSMNMQKRLHS